MSVHVTAILDLTMRDWRKGAEVWGNLTPRFLLGQENEERAAGVAITLVSV